MAIILPRCFGKKISTPPGIRHESSKRLYVWKSIYSLRVGIFQQPGSTLTASHCSVDALVDMDEHNLSNDGLDSWRGHMTLKLEQFFQFFLFFPDFLHFFTVSHLWLTLSSACFRHVVPAGTCKTQLEMQSFGTSHYKAWEVISEVHQLAVFP